jgi:hypothetical protein
MSLVWYSGDPLGHVRPDLFRPTILVPLHFSKEQDGKSLRSLFAAASFHIIVVDVTP